MIVSVLIQIWIFLGSQVLRHKMRSFLIPTCIDGCAVLNRLARFYGISYFWYTLFSIFTALIASVVVNYFERRTRK